MKSVIDAAIKYKGDWPSSNRNELVTTRYDWTKSDSLIGAIEVIEMTCLGDKESHSLSKGCWQILCTKSQFNQCIQELSTNFGRSVAYAEYKADRLQGAMNDAISKTKESNMIPFDLEKALAGDKVICADGEEVSQVSVFNVSAVRNIAGVRQGRLIVWSEDELFMAHKLEDGEAYRFDCELETFRGVYDDNGSCFWIMGLSMHTDKCTNIIKLIPEVK